MTVTCGIAAINLLKHDALKGTNTTESIS